MMTQWSISNGARATSLIRLTAILVFAVGCSPQGDATAVDLQVGELVGEGGPAESMPIYAAQPAPSDFAERGRKLAEVLLGRDFPKLPAPSSVDSRGAQVWQDVGGIPGVFLAYRPSIDDLQVSDIALESDYSGRLLEPFQTKEAARAVFDSTLKRLEVAGLVRVADLDLENIEVGTTEVASGVGGQEPSPPQILDYRFKVKRRLTGGQLRSSLVRVAVSRGGKLASLRIMGGAVEVRAAGTSVRELSDADCSSRLRAEFPNAVIKQQGVGYFLPKPFVEAATVKPDCYFSFIQEHEVQGRIALSRVYHVRYSVSDRNAPRHFLGGPKNPADEDAK